LARLYIPQRYRAPLSSIRSLSEESVHEIRSILDQVVLPQNGGLEANTPHDPGAIITAVKRSATRTNIANLKEILETLATLYEIRSQREMTVEQFVDDICDAMEALDSDERLPHAQRADFAGKLLTLLNAEVFALIAKAHDLMTEDERIFCHARILTDLRPIFGLNLEDGPKAMVVVHTLKLDYHKQGSTKDHGEFYIALNADDLQALKKVIERAEVKAKTLSPTLRNVPLFGAPKE